MGKLDEANPEGRTWSGGVSDEKAEPYGTFDDQTIFEAAQRTVTPDSARGQKLVQRAHPRQRITAVNRVSGPPPPPSRSCHLERNTSAEKGRARLRSYREVMLAVRGSLR